MKNQSLKKRISTATFLFIILFFAALDLESKEPLGPHELTCPTDLALMVPASLIVTNSTCGVGGVPSGGMIAAPNNACPEGSVLQYSTSDAFTTFTGEIPNYNQTESIIIYTRCNCIMDSDISSIINEQTTSPAIASECPTTCAANLSDAVAPLVGITNSTCTVEGGMPSGGIVSAPTTACPSGSTLQYSINNGITWNSTLPSYSQNTAITISTRCLCDINSTMTSMVSRATTSPEICPLNRTTIPTMSQWGLIVFGLLILNIGVVILYRLERILV